MGSCIAKLGDNQYVRWSTVVDAPVTYILTKEEMIELMIEEAKEKAEEDAVSSIQRADKSDTSWIGFGERMSIDDLVSGNHAGEDGEEITLEQIKKNFKMPNE